MKPELNIYIEAINNSRRIVEVKEIYDCSKANKNLTAEEHRKIFAVVKTWKENHSREWLYN